MQAAEVLANYLRAEQERMQDLASRSAVAARELDKAISASGEADQRLVAAQAAHRLAVDGPRPERIAQAAARVAIQEALVELLEDREKKHTIISRFRGYVIAEHTEVGQWVSQGDPVAEVIAVDQVDVVINVLESHAPFVRLGETVRVEAPALVDSLFTGEVAAIVPQADLRTRTFPVKVRVENSIDEAGQPRLKSGMLARVLLPTGASQPGLLVPKDSLVLGGRSTAVWVIDQATIAAAESGGRQAAARIVPVELGVAEGELIQVLGDIATGDLVVVKGNERIPPPRPDQPSLVTWSDTAGEESGVQNGTD
jgi:RND family efflux transporter MFP subunit